MAVRYKIKNTETGLYFKHFMTTRGLRKDGKPRMTGPMWYKAVFDKAENVHASDIDAINYSVRLAIEHNIHDFFDNCEVVAYTMQPTKTTVRLATMRNRTEAKVIMEKLKKA